MVHYVHTLWGRISIILFIWGLGTINFPAKFENEVVDVTALTEVLSSLPLAPLTNDNTLNAFRAAG